MKAENERLGVEQKAKQEMEENARKLAEIKAKLEKEEKEKRPTTHFKLTCNEPSSQTLPPAMPPCLIGAMQ